jgi:adenylate cyclase
VLFTDLRGSTQLYQMIGDAPAFARVLEHFDVLHAGVNRYNGALIKTIRDSIMAAFVEPTDGVLAGIEVLQRLAEVNARHADYPYQLKLGLHTGPALAVTLNDRLDYFGTTINIASRLEGQAEGNDLIVSKEVMHDPGVQRALTERSLTAVPFTTRLRGFMDKEFELYRIRP